MKPYSQLSKEELTALKKELEKQDNIKESDAECQKPEETE